MIYIYIIYIYIYIYNVLALKYAQDPDWSKIYCCIYKIQHKDIVKCSYKSF